MMNLKSLLVLVLFCCAGLNGWAQNDKLSVVACRWVEPQAQEMGLYSIKDSNLEEIARSKVVNGRFAFSFYPSVEGYYAIASNPRSAMYRYVFYFKPGDNLSFEIDGDNYTLTNEMANTPENLAIAQWHAQVQPLEGKSIYFPRKVSTYEDFFPQLEQMLPAIQAFPKATTPNAKFNSSFEDYKKNNFLHIAYMFLNTPRTKHPKVNDYIDFYKKINPKDLSTTTAILDYPDGLGLISNCFTTSLRFNPAIASDKIGMYMSNMRDSILTSGYIANDTVRGEYVLDATASVKTYPGIMEFKNKYGKFLITEDQQRRFRMIQAKYDNNAEGNEAVDFKFSDMNGKQVALSDFKGKVVYVDVWATWCGPCKGEIPHLIKLEESYHNNPNIVFMSVSVDKSKDIDKWKQMIKEKGMGGVQLFAGDDSKDINIPYKISGIPRFLLVGKDGKMINSDAPRPSSSEIKALLNAALKK